MPLLFLFVFFIFISVFWGLISCLIEKKPAYWLTQFQPPRWREAFTVLVCVAVFDVLVFRGSSYELGLASAGISVFLLLLPFLLACGFRSWKHWKLFLVLALMLWCTAGKILYTNEGNSGGSLLCAFFLVALFTAAPLETKFETAPLLRFTLSSLWICVPRFLRYFLLPFQSRRTGKLTWTGCAAIVIPFGIVLTFAVIFVNANPGLQKYFDQLNTWILDLLRRIDWTFEWLPSFDELFVWILLGVTLAGLLAARCWKNDEDAAPAADEKNGKETNIETSTENYCVYYSMFRNTLIGVIAIFAVNLIYELVTRLTWDPPAGFCFGTYCHNGASWLTLALALTTLILAAIFCTKTYQDSRIFALKVLASFWIAENVLLAGFIYARLWIYVQQTGLTRLRVVGFFGTTAIVIALFWMTLKIFQQKNTRWLLQRYAFTVAALFWLYSILPIDAIVWRCNTEMILSGNNGPLVHLADQNISLEGLVQTAPLWTSEDPEIRKGAKLVYFMQIPGYLLNPSESDSEPPRKDWRRYNYVTDCARSQIKSQKNPFLEVESETNLYDEEKDRFREYGRRFYR